MKEIEFSFQNILDAHGIQLSIAGMTIVFLALALVSTFIAVLPHVLKVVNRIIPEVQHAHATPKKKTAAESDDRQIAAAIAMVLHDRARGGQ